MPSPSDVSLPFPAAAVRAAKGSPWQAWQVEPAGNGKNGKNGKGPTLASFNPGDKPFSVGNKSTDQAALLSLAQEIDQLQNLFYADGRHKLLVVLQGTDTSGKDGTVRGVFSQTSPLGVHTVGWKAPTEPERAHDYLWRIHQQMPAAGHITVFNRSHYEDVLVPVVNQWITPEQTRQRYAHINDFERLLAETGTVILKCMLHIGFDEQRERLQERVDDPDKHWKFSLGDLDVRKQWPDYQRAYEDLLGATSTPWAPWTVVPANSKTHRNLMIATLVRDTLKALNLRFPPEDTALKGLRIE
ncbi:PPK2 family polyphosphate kinase [Hydrogenophaga taeniospiralis]|uniref:PPK2 family polyphosphate kinase n=1 Tax=Hydrogenophaga taeniospiralis TaxID=65656 RepID=UPI000CAAC08B|nr:PPK2 family polyphosphate kinase [Hydrogenophaga taeniospiralis]MDP2020067.1 polyphosphate--nucleotide phosphotransferase [Hydrogenophaga sp.]PKO75815.1 MAG: polyphosphate--nucleotide phosphotransferase [Betaproteobacteria bacterium HGW-Betaproteobacteria-15]UCU93725.1 polyphosphate--nucleotide phosphotransferase [Hydrogenophaga taeniospiralis]